MAMRKSGARSLELSVPGFGQGLPGRATTIYCFDTIARWEDEEIGLREDFYVTRVEFKTSKGEGQSTDLALVPKGTELRCG
jgi:prophage tail gpP-like protein